MKKYIADPVKLCLYLGTSLFLLTAGIGGLIYKTWFFAVLFLVSSGAFLFFSIEYAATVELCQTGIRRKTLPWKAKELIPFDKMGEVGVVGTNPRNPNPDTGNRTGVLYIYFSVRPLSKSQRQELTYHFPKEITFLRYTKERYEQVCYFWEKEITLYNTGCKIS